MTRSFGVVAGLVRVFKAGSPGQSRATRRCATGLDRNSRRV